MISSLFHYNQWANSLIAAAIPAELADVEVPSSFNSLRKTVYHVWDSEQIWLSRLQGTPVQDWPSTTYIGSFEGALQQWQEVSARFAQFIETRPAVFFDEELEYVNMRGDRYVQRQRDICLHVVNHCTFHRGQLVTMLRNLGVTTLPNTDMITWFRQS